MAEGGSSRGWWARPAGLATVGAVIALAIGGAVWAITSSSSGNQATPPRQTEPPGAASTTTTAPPGAYNQNAVLWQMPSAGSVVAVGSQVTLGVC